MRRMKEDNIKNKFINNLPPRKIIHVKNEGEYIPQEQLDLLFQGMITHRSEKTESPHLGIGLYVAFQIARFHQGLLKIVNRRDKQGVEVSLVLPIIKLD